jgi:excinuclease ABC subunit A
VSKNAIVVRGARQHNLKNIDITIPRDKLVVITGVSGSGKTSLALDTIYAEGQRRYVESLSAYARQFLGQMDKPDVDYIEGLSPAISIDQRSGSRNPRSTVATVTEIYDYMRLLWARVGHPHCPQCGRPISQQTVEQMVDQVMSLPEGTRLLVLAPLVRGRKGEHQKVFEDIRKAGYVRARVNGEVVEIGESPELDKYKNHSIEAVVDRLTVRMGADVRLADSLETAVELSGGLAVIALVGARPTTAGEALNSAMVAEDMVAGDVAASLQPSDRRTGSSDGDAAAGAPGDILFSQNYACPECGVSLEELQPRMFSFNSPFGACPVCDGLGVKMEMDPDLIIPDRRKSLEDGAVVPWAGATSTYYPQKLEAVAKHFGFSSSAPLDELDPKFTNIILYGAGDETFRFSYENAFGQLRVYDTRFEGVIPNLERRYRESESEAARAWVAEFMSSSPCPVCRGARLKPASLSVTVGSRSIAYSAALSVKEALVFFGGLDLTDKETMISRQILKEITARLGFLANVGLDYLTLDRQAGSLSGGEAQRIRLATQIGSGLVGVLYILDEPSIGLHQRDNTRLLSTLKHLRDLGNTLLVVEHDEETMWAADYIVDMGPGAGVHGGEVVAQGTAPEIIDNLSSLTGLYLSGRRQIPTPRRRREGNGKRLIIQGAGAHNLKGIDVQFPLGVFICVTGVSGSGKSTLVNDILYRRAAQELNGARTKPGQHRGIQGLEHLEKVIAIDQSPIGRTPRSNPATYTGLFAEIRDIFARTPEARIRGYKPGRFSFNVRGGRCEACRGDGILKIEMHFLPDVYVPCDICKGKRYNRETLEVSYRGRNIAEVLDMTVDEVLTFFRNIPRIRRKLQTLTDVGLGYIKLGQPATTLSGGEAQRVKLATELSRRSDGRTLYVLDEPTTGLHLADIHRLLEVLGRLVDGGDTVAVIEHNLEVIKSADWVIDLGPEGGDLGGSVVATGTPEEIAESEKSYTGQFLRRLFERERGKAAAVTASDALGETASGALGETETGALGETETGALGETETGAGAGTASGGSL